MNKYIPIALLFIFAIVVIVLGVWPSYQEFVDLKEQVKVKEVEIENRELYVKNLREIELLLNERESDIAKLDVIIPNSSKVPLLYNLLQKISSGSGLLFREVSSSIKKEEDFSTGLNTIRVNMEIEGSYTGIKEFLILARNAERLLDVKSVGFSVPDDEEKPIKFLIEVNSFSY